MLPRRELLEGSRNPSALEPVIAAAEQALRTWEPQWTGFLEGAVREEAEQRLGQLAELELHAEGGYPGAERCRLLLRRRDAGLDPAQLPITLTGLDIRGNFLFDPCQPDDFRAALAASGLPEAAIGDVWVRGDRGAQAIVDAAAAAPLSEAPLSEAQSPVAQSLVRGVEVTVETVPLEQLQLPVRRQPRRFHTVEASLRLDAVASAGFGLSRSRMAELIRAGEVRVNWVPVTGASRELACGDRIHLAGRGELLLETVSPTKRERWRLGLMRS
ncbi:MULTISPECIES: photosystem II S4 domain protein [Aphanothece]|uniref:photosystem II S4 domain protein n=1 Tax=Aphanothece TaxID=1121 RepID=UPI0039847F1F